MKQRVISAIIMIAICTPFIILGGKYFKVFASILSCICLYELLKYQKNIPLVMQVGSYICLGLILFRNELNFSLEYLLSIIMLFYMISLVFIKNNKYCYKHVFLLIGIVCFLGISFDSIIKVRNNSLDQLVYLLLISIGTDSFALIIGKKFGKKKLAPLISPKKTIEGFIGGCLIGSIIASTFCIIRLKLFHKIFFIIILTAILSVIGQAGDLVKSSIKRTVGIKDFSNLIPGHGGLIDRLDSIIFISIAFILIINLF